MPRCVACGSKLERVGSRGPVPRYCSATCRNRAKWDRQKAANPCPSCGGPMSRSPGVHSCKKCQRAPCGTVAGYGRGCRCSPCTQAKNAEMRRYAKLRKSQGRPIPRPVVPGTCRECESPFAGKPGQMFCSVDCAKRAQGWDGEHRDRWRPSAKLRRSIIERDGGVCQLCFAPVREDVEPSHPRYPHLDHITPRSRGGADSEDNLRLLCAQCNVTRGARVDWVPEVVSGDATGRLAAAV